MERDLDRKRLSMMERCKIAKRSAFSRRRDGIEHHGQKAVGKATAVNEMAQADINHLRSLKRQIASEKRRQGEFTRKMQQHVARTVDSLHRETESSAWQSKHVQECEELERQLKELRNRSRALFEAQGRALLDDWAKKKSFYNRHECTGGFRPSIEGIGKKSRERMNIDHLNGGLEKEKGKQLLEHTEISKGGISSSKINRIGGESIHTMTCLREPLYLINFPFPQNLAEDVIPIPTKRAKL